MTINAVSFSPFSTFGAASASTAGSSTKFVRRKRGQLDPHDR